LPFLFEHQCSFTLLQIPQLFPFIKETSEEWFKPRGVSLSKTKLDLNPSSPSNSSAPREDLLPPERDADQLVTFYLVHFEQIHRVVHLPTFKKQYARFWDPKRPRHPAMTALLLAMMSIATAASTSPAASAHRAMPPQWIAASDDWLAQQTLKGRKLVYYQIACLVYLAKRMNTIRKKRFWIETGSLIQNAILDGLHCDPAQSFHTPYVREMRRRIWAVLRELDLQNSLEYELPTLLHNIESDVAAPANLDDDDFDETVTALPPTEPTQQLTCTSYQEHSSRTWALRLEISRRLFGAGTARALDYDHVLRYTHELTQALATVQSWSTAFGESGIDPKQINLPSVMLQFQLKECILAIHRPYLLGPAGGFPLSDMVCFQTTRDILLMTQRLAGTEAQSVTLLREDLLVASLSLTRLTLLQPRGWWNLLV